MDGVSAANVAQSVQALNQVMQAASQATMDQAEKLVKTTVEMALGQEAGKGGQIDIQA